MDRPPYGEMTPDMVQAICPHVVGKSVWDLGAGDGWHSRLLLRLGASQVTAVDRHVPHAPGLGITWIKSYFLDLRIPPEGIDVAYVAWPVNHTRIPGLERILAQSRVVIYIGTNTGGSACGGMHLMTYLAGREVLLDVPHPRNCLAIYGDKPTPGRTPLLDEWAALNEDTCWSFTAASDAVRLLREQSDSRSSPSREEPLPHSVASQVDAETS